jgi:hypothetical protein
MSMRSWKRYVFAHTATRRVPEGSRKAPRLARLQFRDFLQAFPTSTKKNAPGCEC